MEEHSSSLDRLVHNLKDIKEDPNCIEWILREGIWEGRKFPDLILRYQSDGKFKFGYGIPVELKHCKEKRKIALEQLESGRIYIQTKLGLPVPHGVFVIYGQNTFTHERVHYR